MAALRDGFRWGMSPQEVIDAYAKGTSSIFWKDYDEKLLKAKAGPEMTAIEHERDAFIDSFKARAITRFDRSGSGWDQSGIKGEYTVGNHEAIILVERKGKKRFFFFINDRMWKIYDEYNLVPNGPMGGNWAEAYQKTLAQIGGVQGRAGAADPSHGRFFQWIDWRDNDNRANYLRLVDRSAESNKAVGFIITDLDTERNLSQLRSHHETDPNELDPGVAAVTGGQNHQDPNAPKAAPSSSARGGNKH
jgi:hypothetical protein